MKNQFSIITNIIHEEFNKNAFKTILNELTKICKSKNNKNQLKFFLLKIKIDIENTEINIINKLGKYFTSMSDNLQEENIYTINNKINNIKYFESSNNSLIIDKLLSKTMKNYDDKNTKSLSLYSNKFKSRSNSNENIFKNLNVSGNKFYKKRNNSLSTNNIIKVSKKIKKKTINDMKNSESKNTIKMKKKMEISHQIDLIISNNKKKEIFVFNKERKELAKEIIEFIDYMKLLQENIINKTTLVKNLKYSFEKNKNYLYQKACDIYNSKDNYDNNHLKKDTEEIKVSTNYFNITIENISNNFHNTITDLKNKIEVLENKIKENEEVKKEINKIKIEHLNSIIPIYNLILSSNKSCNKIENNELDKEENKFNWYIKQIIDNLNSINLNCSCHHKIINISDLNMEIYSDNPENNNIKKESNNNSYKTNNSNNLEYAMILDDKNKDIDNQNYNQLKNQIYTNILEIITNILPFIHLYNEKEKENESEIILKLKDDYEQKGLDFIFNILKLYIKQLINIIKEFQRQSNLKENSNLNTNSSITKENDIYMQNIQKKFIIDYNNERIFDDEKPSNNYNLNNSNWYKSIKTPNQTIKNICKEIDNRYGSDYQNKIYSIVSYIQNNLFSKIEYKENEKIELNTKMKELLKINKEIKNNILLNENEIFLKKYNFLNSLFSEEKEKSKILEIEYFSLIKQLFNFIQNGDKIILKLDKLFNKYNKINNNESLNNGHYDLGQSNESDLLSSIENAKNDDFINFLCQNDKDKINEAKNDNNKDLIIKYKKENEFLNKCVNEMKIRLLTIKNNLNKLIKDDYINNNYKDLFHAIFKLLNYSDEQIKTIF